MPPGLAGKQANPISSLVLSSVAPIHMITLLSKRQLQANGACYYNNAPLLGTLAWLSGGHGGYSQFLPVVVPAPKTAMAKPSLAPVTASNMLSIEQKLTASWTANRRTYRRC
ncbi:hypothetical protein ACJRO7_033158 [Eucalyptus globulus]|uniref:Uncharacterized protein n=1 Tax=Eucalyptus globulus TaxID=34317 RepID=A0ABD3JNG2_EUCGL